MERFIAKATLSARHMIVKMIAPSIYRRAFTQPMVPNCVRPAILFVKGIMGDRPLTGAEVGVGPGLNAESILKALNIKMLYLIDHYKPYIDQDRLCFNPVAREEAIKRLSFFRDRIRFFHLDSEAATRSIRGSLDFVYIDGNHTYEYAKRDIETYYRKVKKPGIIGGHDFSNHALGVIRAVTEFSSKESLQLMVEETVGGIDWWMLRQ